MHAFYKQGFYKQPFYKQRFYDQRQVEIGVPNHENCKLTIFRQCQHFLFHYS